MVFITGYSGRFPDADSVPELFEALANKKDCISESKRYPSGESEMKVGWFDWFSLLPTFCSYTPITLTFASPKLEYNGLPARAGHLKVIERFDNKFFKMNKLHVEGKCKKKDISHIDTKESINILPSLFHLHCFVNRDGPTNTYVDGSDIRSNSW